jgi:glycosyltransferase involved in cell wall biosynthesis
MKILHLADCIDRVDGCSKHVLLLALAQVRLGHEVLILTAGGDAVEMAGDSGLALREVSTLSHARRSVPAFLRATRAVHAVFGQFTPDIVHAHHFYAANIAWFAARAVRPRLVQTVHAVIPPVGLLPHCVAPRIIAVSEAVRNGLTERDPGMDARITVIRNGSAFTGDEGVLRSMPEWAEMVVAKKHAFIVAFAGRIVEEKGWRGLVEALSLASEGIQRRTGEATRGHGDAEMRGSVQDVGGTVLLAIAGSGSQETAMRHELRVRELDHVMLGSVPNVRPLLEEADVLVVPSLRMEGLPMVIVEAGLAGIAVIASRSDGIPEIIEDGVHGLLVPPGDSAALAEALLHLRSDDELRRRLAAALQERVQREFSVEAMTARTLELYSRSVIAQCGDVHEGK